MRDNLTLERDADGVALLTLHVVGESNEFTAGLAADLQSVVDEIAHRDDIRGVVITSGRADFLAGARLEPLLAQVPAGSVTPAMVASWVAPVNRTLRKLEALRKPVAAAINGTAQGGGFELCLACHHRVLADDAAVGLTELRSGLMPGGGGTQRLPRLVGIPRALALMLDGRLVPAAEALSLGLVDELLPRSTVVDAARRWVLAHPQAQQPWDVKGYRVPGGAGALAPHASVSFGLNVARARRGAEAAALAPLALLSAVYEGTQLPMDKGLGIEAKYFGLLVTDQLAARSKETTT